MMANPSQELVKCADAFLNNSVSPKCDICTMDKYISREWYEQIDEILLNELLRKITPHLHMREDVVFPELDSVFKALELCPLKNIKVVIVGQDPYHNAGEAMGLAFSVPRGVKIPCSLRNIFKELKDDLGIFKIPEDGDLTNWAKQGVMLLNDSLTVIKNKPKSHSDIGWKEFTGTIIKIINNKAENVVFMLWGEEAKKKKQLINGEKHLILEAAHPSYFSVEGFWKCKHFSKANKYLRKNNKSEINWNCL